MGRKKKPLLAEHGIVHLKHSFVQPTEESGLLKTVGGGEERSALILATGTYGYAIPISSIAKDSDSENTEKTNPSKQHEPEIIEIVDETSDPETNFDDAVPSSKFSNTKSGDKSAEKSSKKEINPEEFSVAELVRVIGGGSGAPLRKCDVVDDRVKVKLKDGAEELDIDISNELEDDPEAEEFYESLGIERSKRRKLDNEGKYDPSNLQSSQEGLIILDENETSNGKEDNAVLKSVANYYKDNASHLYYYSQHHNPYGQHRLEFGPYIDAEESMEYDHDYIQLAKLAQRARAAAQAVALKRLKENEGEQIEIDEQIYDPLPMEVVPSTKAEDLGITVDTNLNQFWQFVKDDPHDFDRWMYLIQYVENTNNLNACRTVYSAFLPLFPYCFGYWKRYSELEKKSYYFGRALAILDKGLEFIPLSVDLWLSYIALFKENNAHQPDFDIIVRKEYERALNTCGMEFRSDSLWESYIDWETENKRLKKTFNLYRRLIQVPSRLYNRHWDNAQLLIRDHHPRVFLEYDEYELMRRKGCKKFGFRYKPEPEVEPGEIRKTSKPEDKLMDHIKTIILKQLTSFHTKCEESTNQRWIFEDKIKRPYFHTKPLDKFQLRNWEEYINFEIEENNYDRTILLFERCLIACAQYEKFWCKYARYVEDYHKEHTKDMNVSVHVQKSKINEELVSLKETEMEEAIIADVKGLLDDVISKVVINDEIFQDAKNVLNTVIEKVVYMERNDNFVFNKFATEAVNEISLQLASQQKVGVNDRVADSPSPDLGGNLELPPKSGLNTDKNIHSQSTAEVTSLLSVPVFPEACFRWQETVRDIYKRACIIHCPRKPIIRLQWAAYEEELGNLKESRQLIQHVLQWFPNFMDAKLQLLDLERRAGNQMVLEKLYEKYLTMAKSPEEFALLSNKYARFMFKECGKADKALTILRKAIRKDKRNPSLYSHVFDICYERYPTDTKGAAAALELAILCKDLSEENKLMFLRRKMLFFQEHGDIRRVRDAVIQLTAAEEKIRKIKAEEQKRKEEEDKEIALLRLAACKQIESLSNQSLQAYPVPEPARSEPTQAEPAQKPIPIEYESKEESKESEFTNGPIKAQIITEGTSVTEAIKDGPESPYQKVAPPVELMVDSSTYGYGSKHPDHKIFEHMAQKEYEKLEATGYPEYFKDTDEDKKFLRQQSKIKHSTKDQTYIVPPSSSYSVVPVGPPPKRRLDPPAPGEFELKPPRAMAILPVPSTAPCVNVPDWFIKEGGELCISESSMGFSTLRYWPHFLTEAGNDRMYRSVRRHVKWHQKQKIIAGHWRYLHRLVSWLGPCDFTHNGMVLQKCEDWPPEILDQLHRINGMVSHEFNSCSLDLYRHGHDWNSWHSDNLPAYGSNPPVAIVTLGSLRILEMKRKGHEFNYIRFPLFPGSLLLMEGVTQADWAHQIIKDPLIKDETLMISFRIMHAIEVPDTKKLMKFVKESKDTQSPTKNGDKVNNKLLPESSNAQHPSTGASSDSPTASKTTQLVEEPAKSTNISNTEKLTTIDDVKKNTKIVFHKVR